MRFQLLIDSTSSCARRYATDGQRRKGLSLRHGRDALKSEKEQAELRKEVLGDFEAKYPKAAKYVKGETEEELRESLKDVMEDFGISEDGDNAEGDEDDEQTVSTRPRSQSLLNLGDKQNGKGGEAELDPDKVAEQIMGGRIFG